ncbi:MAG: AAA family ATPase [bacterium]|nr:AAA family ATPase [bacterium]
MKKLPIGIQTFSKIQEEDYRYVDKTRHIYDLLSSGMVYFLSRPRRFGKSLLLSTLEALFLGRKSLFEGIWIYDRWNFKECPVVKIDFTGVRTKQPEDLVRYICRLSEL